MEEAIIVISGIPDDVIDDELEEAVIKSFAVVIGLGFPWIC